MNLDTYGCNQSNSPLLSQSNEMLQETAGISVILNDYKLELVTDFNDVAHICTKIDICAYQCISNKLKTSSIYLQLPTVLCNYLLRFQKANTDMAHHGL